MKPYRFFLGGADLEMREIRALLDEAGLGDRVTDKGLSWGARASDYGPEIAASLACGEVPVLIELTPDLSSDLVRDTARAGGLIWVDHHGDQAGHDRPSSLEQVFHLIGAPAGAWSRWRQLVAVNDVAHIAGLRAQGASEAEIRSIRDADRAAQGVSPQDEALSRDALATAQVDCDILVVRTGASTSSALMDFLDPAYGGSGSANTLVFMPGKIAFYGRGERIRRLTDIPGCWYGGALPETGYWGANDPDGRLGDVVLARLREAR